MKFENKICFLISWMREIDMFENIFKAFPKKNIFFLVNDLNKSNTIQFDECSKMVNFLKKKNYNHNKLSKVLLKEKFKVLLSTADMPISKISFFSLIKFFYGITFGTMIQFLGLNLVFKKFLGRELIAGGKNASIFDEVYIEKKISQNSIKFPNGLDRNIKSFPNDKWKDIFDIYFTASIYENKLVKKKFQNKRTFNISYSRFDENLLKNKDQISKEFYFDKKKKNIYCCPNERIIFDQSQESLNKYVNYISLLKDNFNLILRPHPKLDKTKPEFIKLLKKTGINLDLKSDRKIKTLFDMSDIIIADYGSSVLEGIYLKKKVLIYSWENEDKFNEKFDKINCLDHMLRTKLFHIKHKSYSKKNKISQINKIISDKQYQKLIDKLNLKLFIKKKKFKQPNRNYK